MEDELLLLPAPCTLRRLPGSLKLEAGKLIQLDCPNPQALLSAAGRFQKTLQHNVNWVWEAVAGAAIPQALTGLQLCIPASQDLPAQGYRLQITPAGIRAEAADPAGIFYAVCTLIQLLGLNGVTLPCLEISDWPDFPVRGVMLDISRDKVPTMETLYALVDMLAGWKINQLQLYTQHTFAYRNHPLVWAASSPMTGQEILELDAFCRERFIELVPNQNSFGHMTRWLTHAAYAPLAETHARFMAPWGQWVDGPFSLCPLDPGSLGLLQSLYDELLPHFSSRMFNVGCDETFDLGVGRSEAECQARGVERVYLDFLLKIYRQVSGRGRTMQFWGDIILHAPALIAELPRDVVALDWGYEAGHSFDEEGARFKESGIAFYVCPGTSAWNSLAGRTDNALGNLLNAAENGLKHGAIGYLNTDWGDHGHWQPLPVSYIGFAAGAAYSWALASNRSLDIARAASRYAFGDPSGAMGRVAYDLGNVYRTAGIEPPNSSALFWALLMPLKEIRETGMLPPEEAFTRAENAIEQALNPLANAASNRPDADLLRRELELAASLLRHACQRGQFLHRRQSITAKTLQAEARRLLHEYRAIWLLRNRPGGLKDSSARFEEMTTEQ